tara:strand:- start:10492 stop:11352 length:861 start_codon:yes stop_codon:yes gene_type:complete
MDNLNIYDNKFYLFKGGGKSKLLIDDNDKIEELNEINDFDYTLIKSILNNMNLDKTLIKNDIKEKLNKLKKLVNKDSKLNKIDSKEFVSKLEELDESDKFNKDKSEVVSNIFDFNQSGGGLFYFIGHLLEKASKAKEAVKKNTFQKFLKSLLFGYNSILGIVDFLLDVSLLSNNVGFTKFDYNGINITHIAYAVLNLDAPAFFSALLGLIPTYGEVAAGSTGLALNLYRLSLFFNKKYKTREELEYDKISTIEEDKPSNTFILKDKYIPKIGSSYNQSFYERIKLL